MGKIKPIIFAVLDIGSSKIVCFIARVSASGDVEVIGVGKSKSTSIRSGAITDLCTAENEILEAVHAAERMAELTVERIVVNVSSNKTRSHIVNVELDVAGRAISNSDIDKLIDLGYAKFDPDIYDVIHCIPMDYTVDNDIKIKDPRGMCGLKLSSKLHILTTPTTALLNLTNCMGRCHLDVIAFLSSSYAVGTSCLSADEQKLGAVIVDIGTYHTTISYYCDGHFAYADNVMLGGYYITHDIAWGFAVNEEVAEDVKRKYGTVISSPSNASETIEVTQISGANEDDGTKIKITKKQLQQIIRPRMTEIFECINKSIEASAVGSAAACRVVLTGGGSQIEGIKSLAEEVLGRHIRLARPKRIYGVAESMTGPSYAKIHGMLMLMAGQANEMMIENSKSMLSLTNNSSVSKVVDWVKENF